MGRPKILIQKYILPPNDNRVVLQSVMIAQIFKLTFCYCSTRW